MKPVFLLLCMLLSTLAFTQCDKTITFKSEKARDMLNGEAKSERALNATIIITKDKISLTATVNGVTEILEGEISDITSCDWLQVLQDGKSTIKAAIKKGREGKVNSIIEVINDNGQTRITFRSDPDKGTALQFDVAEYAIAG
jgi:hypothetical protein